MEIQKGARMLMRANKKQEQRRHARFPALEGMIVALKPHAEILGQMIDISLSGLSFQYIDSTLTLKQRPSSELMILQSKPRLFLDRIPYRTVADFQLANEFSFSSIPVRRRCVEFEVMSLDKRSQLEDFILYCSMMNSTIKRRMDFAHQALEVMHHF
jgi:hypothetical protein